MSAASQATHTPGPQALKSVPAKSKRLTDPWTKIVSTVIAQLAASRANKTLLAGTLYISYKHHFQSRPPP